MPDAPMVLLAEDEDIFRVAFRDFLLDEGFRVAMVADAEGLLARAPDADVLLVDARLPTERLEGVEAVATLLRNDRLSPTVPIIFMSVLGRDEPLSKEKLEALPPPADRYIWLQKPFELEMLSRTIRNALARPAR